LSLILHLQSLKNEDNKYNRLFSGTNLFQQTKTTMMTSAEIRQTFLDFFKSKGHAIVPSAPIVVKNDPTLLFTNAGMNQFKDYFLGNKPAPWNRAADTQKCLRVSGKHNDLEEVGVDTYHHTMFEMLGNWSFGDYFKKDAIAWSWELLTEVYKLDKDRLYVTIFQGDEKEGLERDTEAFEEWKKWIAEDRILLGNKKDNFWEMGDTGPCGPCSEIHVDCRPDAERQAVAGSSLVNNDHPQVIEIWNNVFMQFNRLKDGSLQTLPAQHVDTGMGFERLVRVIQGKNSNYDTDVFTGTIAAIEKISHQRYDYSDSKKAVAFRVIADHIRAICFTIADGQLPSNTGAGYVIRRILRRAVRYAYTNLAFTEPLLYRLVPILSIQFKNVFPELLQQESFVEKIILEEENSFLRTLEKGLARFYKYIEKGRLPLVVDGRFEAYNPENFIVHGAFAFELFDTFGFPIDLTQLLAREEGFRVDFEAFKNCMQIQKNRSRAATAIDAGDWIVLNEGSNTFVGYNDLRIDTQVLKYRKVTAKNKEQFQLVLETTPFYAESGGQTGDKGILQFGEEAIEVVDTKKDNDLIIHFTEQLPADITQTVTAAVNWDERLYTMYNHTATHLLHAALNTVLGSHVAQKGSLVNPAELRFDFSHFAKMTDDEIRAVEVLVNEKIRANIPVIINEMPKEEALKLGATALFGEKYGDRVRVVIIDPAYSIELCGGTHVAHTGMLGLFAITSESAVAAGVRRIEALTGSGAIQYSFDRIRQYKNVSELLKSKDPLKAIEKLLEDKNQLQKKLDQLEAKQLAVVAKELITAAETIGNTQFIGQVVEVSSADALKKLATDIKAGLTAPFTVVLAANVAGKASVAVLYDDASVASGKDAGKTIKEHIAPLIKGGGGGAKNLATAGGQDASNLQAVIEVVRKLC